MSEDLFTKELAKINIFLKDDQLLQLHKYYKFLTEYNKRINLTAIKDKETVYLKHFYDSICLSQVYDFKRKLRICDFGTGAGFPGVVLKIVFPNLNVTLIESVTKKCKFLEELIDYLELNDIKVINDRIEIYSKSNKEKFDLVVARAVAQLDILLEICSQVVKIEGVFVSMKSKDHEEYNKELLCDLGFVNQKEVKYKLLDNEMRSLIIFKKIKTTPNVYPREYKTIVKDK